MDTCACVASVPIFVLEVGFDGWWPSSYILLIDSQVISMAYSLIQVALLFLFAIF